MSNSHISFLFSAPPGGDSNALQLEEKKTPPRKIFPHIPTLHEGLGGGGRDMDDKKLKTFDVMYPKSLIKSAPPPLTKAQIT